MSQQASAASQDAPAGSAADGEPMDGFAFLNHIRDGRWPPPGMMVLLGMEIAEIERGRVVFQALPRTTHYNPAGVVHGGFAATMLDTCMTCAIQSGLKPGLSCTTLDLNVHFTRGATEKTGLLRAEGKVVHLGRQMGTAEGRITDGEGRIIAHATTSCLIFPHRAAAD
jgi:uncharacterized protein (TIGR00369 family)